ncbi:MAG TPA: PD-(D/E)XK nuclease family protein [Candidatus Bathyarchaeia archaeon]|nr:PD-(D/E)XK nuclease family protein [Candidatus Bathyarchaeia archaeon]
MNKYKQRERNLFSSNSKIPFRISRGKIDLFLDCSRCFYLDRKLGLARPSMPGFALNSAVDQLLKNEFDLLRKNGEKHELMKRYGINAVPYSHPDLPVWRDDIYRFIGASIIHKPTNFEICGIIDDVWINQKAELVIVDYKSTSTSQKISLEDEYKQSFKKQLEIYQWIFRRMGFQVNDTGYFVYANAGRNRPKFDGRLEFELMILSHQGDDSWVEPVILAIKKCLEDDKIPAANPSCEYCQYRKLMSGTEGDWI